MSTEEKNLYEIIENFLVDICGYKSIEDAIENTPQVNLYPIYGELEKK